MRSSEGFTRFGKFSVASDRDVYGELRVNGRGTFLYLRDDDFFDVPCTPDEFLIGTLHDLTKVTLIQCVPMERFGTCMRDGERYHYAKLFPHFVLEGRRHLEVNDSTIVEISFVLEDAAALFYDFDAFGTVIDAAPYIEQITTANKIGRLIPTGSEPQIAYFSGKRTIIEADTALGKVRAQHNPRWSTGGPGGVHIDNTISINIVTEHPVAFDEAIDRVLRLLRFFELVIGRPQNLHELDIHLNNDDRLEPLKVHWSNGPSRDADSAGSDRSPYPADLLLDPIRRRREFSDVICGWFAKDKERQDARQRFNTSFAHQQIYSVERLIGAANMFDILPDSASPKDIDLTAELLDAKRLCREKFRALPNSYERSSVLSALGRLGKASLKHKTRHRAQNIVDAIGERLPDLVLVLDEAVNCRNHYVHGSASKIDYSQNFDMIIFFTDTLEFVFASSDLMDAGWNIRNFIERSTCMTHPFGTYRVNYNGSLQELHDLIDSKVRLR